MRKLVHLLRRLRALFHRDALDREMDEEMRFHLEMQARKNEEAGVPGDEAEHLARRQFGRVDGVKENIRERCGIVWLENLWRDVMSAIRSLRKSPGYALTVIAILTLTIASVALVRLFYDTVRYTTEPLVLDPDNLLQVSFRSSGERQWHMTATWSEWEAWRSNVESLSAMAGYYTGPSPARIGDQHHLFSAVFVTPDFFTTLGVKTKFGRTFAGDDFPASGAESNTVIISDRLWQSRFGSDPDILGREFNLGVGNLALVPHTVIGVMPPGFRFPDNTDYWLPTPPRAPQLRLIVLARLRDGVARETAQAEMETLLARQTPIAGDEATVQVGLFPHRARFTSPLGRYLELMMWAVLAVQVMACVNIAGLTLARGLIRLEATAVRIALGASRWHLMRQVLMESGLLVAAGLAGGLGVAWVCRPAMISTLGLVGPMPDWWTFSLSARTLSFTTGVTAVTVFAFNLIPAWLYSNPRLANRLHAAGSMRHTGRSNRPGSLAVAAQSAVAVVLLAGAALALADLRAFRSVDLGSDARGVAYFVPGPIGLPRDHNQAFTYYQRITREIATSPGIDAVGIGRSVPGFGTERQPLVVEGGATADPDQRPTVDVRVMTPSVLDVLRIRLLRGRRFTETDMSAANPVVLIDRVLADRLFPHDDPLGKRISVAPAHSDSPQWETIVGIVGPTRSDFRTAEQAGSVIRLMQPETVWSSAIYVRGQGNWAETARTAIAPVRRVEPRTVIYPTSDGASLQEMIERNFWLTRLLSRAMSVFALLGFGIAAIGIYGLVAFAVNARRREIGIRMALGATGARVVRQLILGFAKIIVPGLGIGALFAFVFAEKVGYLIEKVDPRSPMVHLSALGFLLIVAAFACYLPARRAAKIDPATTLRAE